VWSATWGSTPKKRKEIILGRIDGEGSFIAVWELEAPVGEFSVHTCVAWSRLKLMLALIWVE